MTADPWQPGSLVFFGCIGVVAACHHYAADAVAGRAVAVLVWTRSFRL